MASGSEASGEWRVANGEWRVVDRYSLLATRCSLLAARYSLHSLLAARYSLPVRYSLLATTVPLGKRELPRKRERLGRDAPLL